MKEFKGIKKECGVEIKEKLTDLKQALPMMKDFGGLDTSALKTITESLDEILNLCQVLTK